MWLFLTESHVRFTRFLYVYENCNKSRSTVAPASERRVEAR